MSPVKRDMDAAEHHVAAGSHANWKRSADRDPVGIADSPDGTHLRTSSLEGRRTDKRAQRLTEDVRSERARTGWIYTLCIQLGTAGVARCHTGPPQAVLRIPVDGRSSLASKDPVGAFDREAPNDQPMRAAVSRQALRSEP